MGINYEVNTLRVGNKNQSMPYRKTIAVCHDIHIQYTPNFIVPYSTACDVM
jgi:hypothetical protein